MMARLTTKSILCVQQMKTHIVKSRCVILINDGNSELWENHGRACVSGISILLVASYPEVFS